MEMVCSSASASASASASKRQTTSFHIEKMTLEDYRLLIQSNSHLHLTVAHLNQVIGMHGYKKIYKVPKNRRVTDWPSERSGRPTWALRHLEREDGPAGLAIWQGKRRRMLWAGGRYAGLRPRIFQDAYLRSLRVMNILRPCIHQGGSSGKVSYFKASHVKINYDELFQDFLETYSHTILHGVRVRRVKEGSNHELCNETTKARKKAIKFHPYYFVLGFTLLCGFITLQVTFNAQCCIVLLLG